jgi:hypothetical protein
MLSGSLALAILASAFGVEILLAGCTALVVGLATTGFLWGPPRVQWEGVEDQQTDLGMLGVVAAVSVTPMLALFPLMLLDGVALGTRVAVSTLAVSFGFLGFAGCLSLLVVSHRRAGGRLTFVTGQAQDS